MRPYRFADTRPPITGIVAALLACTLMLTATAGSVQAAEKLDKPAIETLTAQAAAVVAGDCDLTAARGAFYPEGPFRNGPLYVTVLDTNGTWRVYPPGRKNEGKSILNITDQDGVMIVQEILKTAASLGSGWINYRWLNPDTNQIQIKDAFVQAVPACNLVVVIGQYR